MDKSEPSSTSSNIFRPTHNCLHCNSVFSSRNQLFKHVKLCQEEVFKGDKVTDNVIQTTESAESDIGGENEADLSNCIIYVTGGRVRGRTLASVEKFTFSSQKWELCAPLLENRGSHGATAINDKVYVIGGGGFDSNLATCEVYHTQDNTWHYIASTNIFRHALILVPFQFKVDGQNIPSNSNNIGTNNDSFSKTLLSSSNTSSSNDRNSNNSWYIYAIGGWINGTICSAGVERYDVRTNEWYTCTPMNVARRLLGACAYHNESIYVFGGNCDDGIWYTSAVEGYNPYSDSWKRLSDMPITGPTSAVNVGNYIYIFAHGKNVYQYNPLSDTYIKRSELPLPEWYTFDTTNYGIHIFIHGGATKGVFSKAMYCYNTVNDTWKQMPDMLRQRRRTAAALVVSTSKIIPSEASTSTTVSSDTNNNTTMSTNS